MTPNREHSRNTFPWGQHLVKMDIITKFSSGKQDMNVRRTKQPSWVQLYLLKKKSGT